MVMSAQSLRIKSFVRSYFSSKPLKSLYSMNTTASVGGSETGGKFLQPLIRRYQTKLCHQPSGGRWFSKLPYRLVIQSANRLFETVIQNRLLPSFSNSQLPETDLNQETELQYNEANITVEDANVSNDQINPTNDNGFAALKQTAMQKTFTRLEADRLSSFLHLKSNGNQMHGGEVVSKHKDKVMQAPIGMRRPLDKSSPAITVKNYSDGGRKPSLSILRLPGQVDREDSAFLKKTLLPQQAPTMSLLPNSFGKSPLPEYGFVTPRSRGRSAVYRMSRRPYSKPQPIVKGFKRMSLVDDIESAGPVKRICQRVNLSSRSVALPASNSPLFIRGIGGGFNWQHASSRKSALTSKSIEDILPVSSLYPVPAKSEETASKILQQCNSMASTREKLPSKLSASMLHGPALKSLQNVSLPIRLDNIQDKKADLPSSSYQEQEKPKDNVVTESVALYEKPIAAVDVRHKLYNIQEKSTDLSSCSYQEQAKPKESESRKTLAPHEKLVACVDDGNKAGSSKDGDASLDSYSVKEHPLKNRVFKRIFQMNAQQAFSDSDEDSSVSSSPPPLEEEDESIALTMDEVQNDTLTVEEEENDTLTVEEEENDTLTMEEERIRKAKGKEVVYSEAYPLASGSILFKGKTSHSKANGFLKAGRNPKFNVGALSSEAVMLGDATIESTSYCVEDSAMSNQTLLLLS